MTPTERLELVTKRFTDRLDELPCTYKDDLSTPFNDPKMFITQGAFEQYTDQVFSKINTKDKQTLALKKDLKRSELKGPEDDPTKTFSDYYYPLSIGALTRFVARLLGTSVYTDQAMS